MESKPLPAYMHLTITEENGSKRLKVYSRVHVNKEVAVGPSYSDSFSDVFIIKDLSGEILHRFGV